jgi:CheY-like chemotaxis protein
MDHILLLEDDAQLRTAFVRFLQDRGPFEVTAAGSLKEAVSALGTRAPQLVLTDLELPDGCGLDLLSELAARKLAIPVVVVTAFRSRFQAQLAESPQLEIISKPFDAKRLLQLLHDKLRQTKTDPPTSAFSVADYLQLAGMARRSVALQVHQGGLSLGQITVIEGVPRFAIDATGEGEVAFRRLALLQNCNIVCQPLIGQPPRVNLNGSLEHLLIDAARESDEFARAAARPDFGPPPKGGVAVPPSSPANEPIAVNTASSGTAPGSPPALPPRAQRPPPPRPVVAVPAASSGTPLTPQEKSVNATKPSFVNLVQIMSNESSLEAMARADRQGSVLDSTGRMDAETACAVATMAAREVAEAAAELGLGRPLGFQVSTHAAAFYVVHRADELLVGRGTANKNPIVILRKVCKSSGATT